MCGEVGVAHKAGYQETIPLKLIKRRKGEVERSKSDRLSPDVASSDRFCKVAPSGDSVNDPSVT